MLNRNEIKGLMDSMTLEEKLQQLVASFPNANVDKGIPHMQQGECLHGVLMPGATCFPQALALGSTWDYDLVKRVATVIAHEARSTGIQHCFTPMLGVARDPRWGRTEESYGEDPHLVSEIGLAFIKGLQGEGDTFLDANHVVSTAKHFVADGEPLGGRNGAPMDISERTLREVHLLPFERAVKEAQVQSIMPAHHALNGVPCHMNPWILKDILRGEWGFEGVIVSDNNDVKCLHTLMKVAETQEKAAKLALEAGVDIELAWLCEWDEHRYFGKPIIQAIEEGFIDEAIIDKALSRVLKMKSQLGLFEEVVDETMDINISTEFVLTQSGFEKSYAETKSGMGKARADKALVFGCESHRALAREAAKKAIVLLKNDKKLLPIDKKTIKKIALVGPNADCVLLGGYSRFPNNYVTVLEGIKAAVGSDTQVTYSEGCVTPRFLVKQGDREKTIECENNADAFKYSNVEVAVNNAKEAEIAIVVLGGSEVTCKENQDRDSIDLVGDQEAFIKQIYETGTPVVCIMLHGRPNTIPWIADHIPVILDGFYLGQETGNGVADVLFGDYNPSGKLPITVPRHVGQVPCYYNQLIHGRAKNYYDTSAEPLFHFGHGLSYSEFEITSMSLDQDHIDINEAAKLVVEVKNCGEYDGEQVVQLYVNDLFASVVRSEKDLKGFKKIYIPKGESRSVVFDVGYEQLKFFKGLEWVVEPGEFELLVGFDSVKQSKISLYVGA